MVIVMEVHCATSERASDWIHIVDLDKSSECMHVVDPQQESRVQMCLLQFHKPEYARKPIVQDTFYRRTTAFAPQGGTAVAASG